MRIPTVVSISGKGQGVCGVGRGKGRDVDRGKRFLFCIVLVSGKRSLGGVEERRAFGRDRT